MYRDARLVDGGCPRYRGVAESDWSDEEGYLRGLCDIVGVREQCVTWVFSCPRAQEEPQVAARLARFVLRLTRMRRRRLMLTPV